MGGIFYQLGAAVYQAPSKIATMLLLPYIKLNMHTQRGGLIIHVLRLHFSGTKEPERKLNQHALLTYFLGINWEASMQTLMRKSDRKLA